jgi:hypothetical protein
VLELSLSVAASLQSTVRSTLECEGQTVNAPPDRQMHECHVHCQIEAVCPVGDGLVTNRTELFSAAIDRC